VTEKLVTTGGVGWKEGVTPCGGFSSSPLPRKEGMAYGINPACAVQGRASSIPTLNSLVINVC